MDNPFVAKKFKIGNTKIEIWDDYCRDKTKADVDAILQRISNIASIALLNDNQDDACGDDTK